MRLTRTIVVSFALSVCLTAGLSWLYSIWIFNLPDYGSHMGVACTIAAVVYPCLLRFARSDSGYWRGLLVVLAMIAVSLGVAESVYYAKMEPIHQDFGESVGLLAFFLGALELVAALWYSIAYFLLRAAAKMARP